MVVLFFESVLLDTFKWWEKKKKLPCFHNCSNYDYDMLVKGTSFWQDKEGMDQKTKEKKRQNRSSFFTCPLSFPPNLCLGYPPWIGFLLPLQLPFKVGFIYLIKIKLCTHSLLKHFFSFPDFQIHSSHEIYVLGINLTG